MPLLLVALVSEVPEKKDVVTGALGAGAALAGLILVFLGIIIAAYQGYPPGTPSKALTRHKIAVAAVLVVFFLSLGSAALSLLWLTTDGGGGALYGAVVATFFVQLVTVFGVAVYTTYGVLLR